MTPKISFAITTHNEGEYIQKLLDQLIPHCRATGDDFGLTIDIDLETKAKELALFKYRELV